MSETAAALCSWQARRLPTRSRPWAQLPLVLQPAHPGVIALLADHVLKRYGQVLPPRDRAGRLGPDDDLVAGLSVLRIHLEVASSSLPGLRSPQKTQVAVRWAFTTDRTYRERCLTGPVHCPVCSPVRSSIIERHLPPVSGRRIDARNAHMPR